MIEQKVTVQIRSGLHFRPAEKITAIALEYPCVVKLKKKDFLADMKSFLSVLAANVKVGEEVVILCDGEKEAEAMERIVEFLSKEAE